LYPAPCSPRPTVLRAADLCREPFRLTRRVKAPIINHIRRM